MADFTFDRSWRFPLARQELWSTLEATDEYRRWWRWLRSFDAPPLEAGAVATATIGSPLPYALAVRIQLVEVAPPTRVVGRVSGDLEGVAALDLADGPGRAATLARLRWTLALRHRLLAPAATLLRPVLEWGHDRVVETGVEQFRSHAVRVGAHAAAERACRRSDQPIVSARDGDG